MTKEEIKARRIELNMSQSELARRCNCTDQTISNIERGIVKPSELTMSKIKKVLKVK